MSNEPYATTAPSRAEVDAYPGATLIQFGTDWCGFCKAAEPLVDSVLADYSGVRHLKIEDGSGRPLGRSFRIKLWPTLIFMRDGVELSRLVRPSNVSAIEEAFEGMVKQG
ncbi:thioredoxin family protein [Pseudomonas caspiana]|uniref:thioredoxin family protein n=1 Tax=Pseudomonas caspiana TaxID=1451454 RepID=UPI0032EBBEC1